MEKCESDIYFKFIIGSNCYQSEAIKSDEQQGDIPIKTSLFADNKENKMTITAWQKTIVKDELLASGCIYLDSINNGSNNIDMNNEEGESKGSVSVNISSKQSPCSSLVLSNISISISEEDNIGNS